MAKASDAAVARRYWQRGEGRRVTTATAKRCGDNYGGQRDDISPGINDGSRSQVFKPHGQEEESESLNTRIESSASPCYAVKSKIIAEFHEKSRYNNNIVCVAMGHILDA